ncbi:MAG: hypothetical protein Q7U97_06715 [Rhodocyclaceae bacterium]|nr:hypothetical protein [Rhodocyclaceae bacterium]
MTMTTIAVLDETGVYLGTAEIDEAYLADGHVHLPEGCDLPLGQYRWDAARKTFVPLESPQVEKMREPHTLNAIAAGFVTLWSQGVALPNFTLEWLDFYVRSLDFVGAHGADLQLRDMCHRFITRSKEA